MNEINAQLTKQRLIIKQGKHNNGESMQDPEAAHNVKQVSDVKRKATYGFKAHANVDEDGFKDALMIPGNARDSTQFERLLTGNEEMVYADSAYKSKKNTASFSRNVKSKRESIITSTASHH